jgi:preprotein translocase subunit SecA
VKNRRQVMDYDEVMKRQRNVIYSMRNRLLKGEDDGIDRNAITEVARENIRNFIQTEKTLTRDEISRFLMDNISYIGNGNDIRDNSGVEKERNSIEDINPDRKSDVEKFLLKRVTEGLENQENNLGKKSRMDEFLRVATLTAIDDAWVEEVDYLNQLQAAVSGRASAQRNLVFEYQKEARYSFDNMEKTIKKNIMRNVLLSSVYVDDKYKMHIILP